MYGDMVGARVGLRLGGADNVIQGFYGDGLTVIRHHDGGHGVRDLGRRAARPGRQRREPVTAPFACHLFPMLQSWPGMVSG